MPNRGGRRGGRERKHVKIYKDSRQPSSKLQARVAVAVVGTLGCMVNLMVETVDDQMCRLAFIYIIIITFRTSI